MTIYKQPTNNSGCLSILNYAKDYIYTSGNIKIKIIAQGSLMHYPQMWNSPARSVITARTRIFISINNGPWWSGATNVITGMQGWYARGIACAGGSTNYAYRNRPLRASDVPVQFTLPLDYIPHHIKIELDNIMSTHTIVNLDSKYIDMYFGQ